MSVLLNTKASQCCASVKIKVTHQYCLKVKNLYIYIYRLIGCHCISSVLLYFRASDRKTNTEADTDKPDIKNSLLLSRESV